MIYSLDGYCVVTPPIGQFWVAPSADVCGKVIIGEDASVWFNTVVRGDNDTIRIGKRTNIQDGSVLHTDPGFPLAIESDCVVGHMVMLHGCTIGRGSLIGIGATVLNGAVIGEECLIGARAFVGEGKVIPPRSLVMGLPGRVIRSLSDEEVARIQRTARSYVEKWRHFEMGLVPQV